MIRVLFIQDSAINESLVLTEVSALLKQAGHQTHLLLMDEERDLPSEIRNWNPALAIVPCSIAHHRWALSAARAIKEVVPDCIVAMGGTHVTFDVELVRDPHVDVVCVGEAEYAMVDLAEAIEAGRSFEDIENLAVERGDRIHKNPLRPVVEDLDSLPMPDRDLYFRYRFMARFPWKKFATGRGCIHDCTFCWNTTLRQMYAGKGTFVRRKTPDRAVDEIAWVQQRYPLDTVHFSDDLFTVHPSWLEAFAAAYRSRVGVPFSCNTSVELVSARTARALADAGCRTVAIGVETGNERLRAQILGKTVTDDEIRRAAGLIKDHGMELTTFNMLASPGETLEDAFSTIRLNREIGADHVRVNIAVPIPHTGFERDAMARDQLADGYASDRVASLRRPRVAFASTDDRAFENLFYLFRLAVHYPEMESTIRRIVRWPLGRMLDPLRMMIPIEEKRINGLSWRAGLRFFRHVGDPHKKTSNYVTLM